MTQELKNVRKKIGINIDIENVKCYSIKVFKEHELLKGIIKKK